MGTVFKLIGILVVAAILAPPVWDAIKQIKGTNEAIAIIEGLQKAGQGDADIRLMGDSAMPKAVEVKAECPDYRKRVAQTAKDMGGSIDPNKVPCPTGL